ncbi:MAG: Gfo/Idh/MocA family oxidoreductase [Paludibacterium sp.]|uniref:Gfo/Idh/MocA family protein n=1 Tax=Paludibacterium sp. TaxID=1917523 RepID=UPI00260089CD|nr:Gfo/Idh/MocA family oxidoreductase [Paludibacterium sp.]MBV8045730.1 Gfo/Idh/MocA family oxidoreductase [Paludibacterium sp.]
MPQQPSAPVRFGIIGAGRIAQRFVDSLRHVPEARLRHVWARRPEAAAALALAGDASPCDSLEALLASDIDAVYIATLHDSHAHYARAVLAAGKAVLCEKPAALNAAQLEGVLAEARRHRRLFMEAMKPPFFPLYQRLRQHLAQAPIGPVRLVRAGFSTSTAPADSTLFQHDQAGGSLLDIGIYGAFLAVDWLGEAREVQTLGRMSDGGVDLFASLNVRFDQGMAQLFSGLDVSGKGDAMLAGTLGHVTLHDKWWNPAHATIQYNDGRVIELNEPAEGGGLNYETAHFCQLLRQGALESPLVSHDHSRRMIAILDAARATLGLRYAGE